MVDQIRHRTITLRRVARRWRFKWEGRWLSFPDLETATASLDRLLDEREWARLTTSVHSLGSLTISDLVEEYLNGRTDLAPKTLREYRAFYRNHIKPRIGHLNAATVRRRDLRPFFADLTPKLAREIRCIVNCAYAEHDDLPNPVAGLRLPAYKAEPVVVPYPEEVEKILLAAAEHSQRWYGWCRVVSVAGTRRSETCVLHERNVDFETLALRIDRSLCKVTKRLKEQKTKAGARELIFDDTPENHAFFDLLRELVDGSPSGFLFPPERSDSRSPCLSPDGATHRFHRMCERLGLCRVWSRREGREVTVTPTSCGTSSRSSS